jgi:hypothetical protein
MSSLGSVGCREVLDWGAAGDLGESSGSSDSVRVLDEPLELERPKRPFEPEGYGLRPSTIEAGKASQAKTPIFKRRRKVLTPTKTASMFTGENHDCSELNVNHTESKVTARLFFSLFRFAVSYAWECETKRGGTHYNGASSGCHGRCHAAHAALSPALEDNYLQQIGEKVKLVGYEGLSDDEKQYLNSRFIFEPNDYKLLSSKVERIRSDFIERVMSGLEAGKQSGSFVQTPLDYERNVTYEGPAASNRVDCRLEQNLRPLEDELAEKCRVVDALPKEALRELFFLIENCS